MRTWILVAVGVLASSTALAGPRLDRIRQRGSIVCGVNPGIAGFAEVDARGRYAGFEVDLCRAVAAAIFGSADRVTYLQASNIRDFLKSSAIDIVSRRLTMTLTRDAPGVAFGPTVFYDGQGFLVARTVGAKTIRSLSTRPICVDAGTPFESTLSQYFRTNKLQLTKVVLKSPAEAAAALQSGRCAAYTADVSELGSVRLKIQKAGDYDILPEQISKEPLALFMPDDDRLFVNIVRWTMFALMAAEELGISSSNVDQMLTSDDPARKRLLGVVPGNGKALGLDERWAYQVIKAVGNYGEVFDRNVGARSAVRLERGLNRLWTEGGLIYAPPLQ